MDKNDTGKCQLARFPHQVVVGKQQQPCTVATTATNANGNYVFYDISFGNYTVVETNSVPFPFNASDIDGGNLNMMIAVMINPADGANFTGNDFVHKPSRTIPGEMLEEDVDKQQQQLCKCWHPAHGCSERI